MGALDKQQYKRETRAEIQTKRGYLRIQNWTTPAAANATFYTSAATMASGGTLTTFSGQPTHPRNVQIVASGATAASVTINGLDIRGNAITETLTLNGTTPVLGVKAFASITSVVLPTVSATINIGTGVKFGLDRMLPGATIISTNVDNAADTAPTLVSSTAAITNNTITFATAPNGTHSYFVVFVTQEITAAKQTTS